MVEHAILLAGGSGSRLRPFTYYTSKHLLPVYDKPMIMYPIANLLLLGVKNICIVINPDHEIQWKNFFNKLNLPININLINQKHPEGIPHAQKICEKIIGKKDHYLALGDNILIGSGMLNKFKKMVYDDINKISLIGFRVKNPKEFGVAEFNKNNLIKKVVEKPSIPNSNVAVVGLYKFSSDVFEIFNHINKSSRNEYEVCDLINYYISKDRCNIMISDSVADYWLDTGNINSLISATNFIKELSRSGNVEIANLNKISKDLPC